MADQQKSSAFNVGKALPLDLSYYQILEIEPNATFSQIRQAYRQKSKQYHPDTTLFDEEDAAEKFQLVNHAYKILTDPEQKNQYDKWRLQSQDLKPPLESDLSDSFSHSQSAYLDAQDRPLSPGEVFALFILGITFLACLVLALVVGIARGEVFLTDFPTHLVPPQSQPSIPQPDLSSDSVQPLSQPYFFSTKSPRHRKSSTPLMSSQTKHDSVPNSKRS